MSDKLLPCPFCGGKAEVERIGDSRQSHIVCCEDCGCLLESNESGHTLNHQWNTRKHTRAVALRVAQEVHITMFNGLLLDLQAIVDRAIA